MELSPVLSVKDGGVTTVLEKLMLIFLQFKKRKDSTFIFLCREPTIPTFILFGFTKVLKKLLCLMILSFQKKLVKMYFSKLKNGAKVLLFPQTEDVQDKSVPGHFPPEFWNYGMFKGISEWAKKAVSPGTLGLLTDPEQSVV